MREVCRSEFADMLGDVIEVVEVDLFFFDDLFEEFGADAISIGTADFEEFVVIGDGLVFESDPRHELPTPALPEIPVSSESSADAMKSA